MRIGRLADSCDCSRETIRYYEKIGLLPPAMRSSNGYRSYDASHQKWLMFILRSKALEFSQNEVRRLTNLADTPNSTCKDVHRLILAHIDDVRARLRDLQQLESSLLRLEAKCIDETLHECPVIDELMATPQPLAMRARASHPVPSPEKSQSSACARRFPGQA